MTVKYVILSVAKDLKKNLGMKIIIIGAGPGGYETALLAAKRESRSC